MAARKLYGIWIADYSASYVVESVYSSLEHARAVARAVQGDVIEFDVDPPLGDEAKRLIRPGEVEWSVGMDADGDQASAYALFTKDGPDGRLRVNVKGDAPRRFALRTWATDEKHAIKILNDRRARWIAAGAPLGAIAGDTPEWRVAVESGV